MQALETGFLSQQIDISIFPFRAGLGTRVRKIESQHFRNCSARQVSLKSATEAVQKKWQFIRKIYITKLTGNDAMSGGLITISIRLRALRVPMRKGETKALILRIYCLLLLRLNRSLITATPYQLMNQPSSIEF